MFYARHTSAAIFGSDKSKFPTEWYYIIALFKIVLMSLVPCSARNRKFTLVWVSLLLLSSVCFVKGYRNLFFRSKYIDDRDFH